MDAPDALTSAANGMRLQADRLDVIAQNLANVSTIGYQGRAGRDEGFDDRLASAVARRDAQGALRRTGVPTDLALAGRGYFAVATPEGVRYTRDGRFLASAGGCLMDARGNHVLGALGAAQFSRGAHVEPDGRILANGRVIDRLRIASFGDSALTDDGPYLYAPASAVPARAPATVHAGYLEQSCVDPISEMTSLVATQRAYEANQKSAQRADETLRRTVVDVPAVRP